MLSPETRQYLGLGGHNPPARDANAVRADISSGHVNWSPVIGADGSNQRLTDGRVKVGICLSLPGTPRDL